MALAGAPRSSAAPVPRQPATMPSLRVLHVNKLYAPWIGGVEAAVQALAEEAAAQPGVEVEVLACQPRGPAASETVNGVRVVRTASLGMWLSTPLSPTFPRALASARGGFDVVHVHLPFPLAMLAGWRWAPTGPRLVLHYHADVSKPVQRAILRLLEPWNRRLFEAADKVVVTSERLLGASAVLAPYREKCLVIPLPAAEPGLRPATETERAEARTRLGLRQDRQVVLFVGRLVGYKGLPLLVEAMAGVDADLLVVGEGPLRSALLKQARRHGLADRLRLAGRLDAHELDLAYQVADLFVLPSVTVAEAFGLVQVEAMQRGCPVVNTDLPTGVPSVGVHGETGLTVPPGDPAALREAIRRILGDDALRAAMGRAALQRATLFDRPSVGRRLVDLYRSLLAGASSPPAPETPPPG